MRSVLVCAAVTLWTFGNCLAQVSVLNVATLDMPYYPPLAKTARIEGQVTIEIEINPEGKTTSAKASAGPELLKDYTLKNIATWMFHKSAATRTHSVKGYLIYEFKLTGTSDKPFERITFSEDRVLIEASPPEINTVTTD